MIYLLGTSLNTMGGSMRFILNVICILRQKGYRVATVMNDKTDWNYPKHYMGLPVVKPDREYALMMRKLQFFGIYQRLFTERFLKFLKVFLSKEDVVVNSLGTFYPVLDVHVNYVHGYTSIPLSRYKQPLKRLYYFPYKVLTSNIKRYLEKQDDMITVANSKYTAQKLQAVGIESPVVAYPPVATEVYSHLLDCEKNDSVILVTRFTQEENKGTDEFIALAKMLPKVQFVCVAFAIPSNQWIVNSVKKKIPRNVRLYANVSSEERLRLLGSAKIFLSLGRDEHFGYTLCEAMSAGCTPIVYPEGGPLEIVEGTDCYLTEDLEQARASILDGLDRWNLKDAKERSESIERRFGFEQFAEKFIPILKRVELRDISL